MKTTKILFSLLSLLLFLSCGSDDEEILIIKETTSIVDIGEYNLLDESLKAMPYFGGKDILFVDSIGNELEVTVTEFDIFTYSSPNYLYKYDVYEEGDTVKYAYTSQSMNFSFEAPSLEIKMNLSLMARPYYSDPESRAIADVINIFCVYPEPVMDTVNNLVISAAQVFYHLVNQRTWPNALSTFQFEEELVLLGRSFKDVYSNQITETKSKVYYNYELGILSFEDHTGKTWRFEKWL